MLLICDEARVIDLCIMWILQFYIWYNWAGRGGGLPFYSFDPSQKYLELNPTYIV